MTVSVENVNSAGTSSTQGSLSCTLTTVNANLLIVCVCIRLSTVGTVTGVTFDGVAMTQVNVAAYSTSLKTYMFYLKNPHIGVGLTCTATFSTNHNAEMGAIGIIGADPTTPLGTSNVANGSSGTAAVTVSSQTGDLVIDAEGDYQKTPTPDGSQSSLYVNTTSTVAEGGSSTKPGAASVTMQWTMTSTSWAIVAVPIHAAPVSGPNFQAISIM